MALGTPVAAAAAYSAASGTTVAPAYPTGILASDVVVLFVGQKPTAVGGGTVATPTGWTLQDSLTNAGGYTAQGVDSGNTNLFVYTWNTPVAGQTGSLTVTIGGNDVTWAFMVRIPKGAGSALYGSADGQRTTTPTSPMSIALTNGATAANFQTGDLAIWAMCIPTDVTTPAQFSAQSITATGATFATAVELNEPDSTTGNDIGGYSAYASVSSGTSTTAPTVTVTVGGTLTNVRGPVVLLRVREAAVTHATTGTLTGQGSTVTGTAQRNSPHATTGTLTGQGSTVVGAADRQSGTVTHATTGALTGPGSTVAGTSARFRAFATTGALTGPGSTVVGASARTRAHPTTGVLTGPGAAVAGSANRIAGPVTHATSGALNGPGTTVAGAAARTRAHATSGVLTAQGAVVTGAAVHNVPHATTGALTGLGSSVTGAAARTRVHATTGVLSGQGSIVVGASAISTTHFTTGELVGPGAVVEGSAVRISLFPDPSEVAAGVQYGPGGIYVGTLTATPGQITIGLRSFTGRF